ncbi:MAG: hypothetical protein IPH74_14125 [Bacteroidetes bacterium]|nr:hypothetical protein [Bacteroidota bacterium]
MKIILLDAIRSKIAPFFSSVVAFSSVVFSNFGNAFCVVVFCNWNLADLDLWVSYPAHNGKKGKLEMLF